MMSINYYRSFLLLAGILMVSASHAQYFEVDNYEEKHTSGTVYSFPILKLKATTAVAQKINEQLQKQELEALISPVKKGAFASIWPDKENPYSGTTEYSYEIVENNDRFITITFNGEGCGAYCEGFYTTYNFDSQTGAQLKITDLLTAAGKAFIGQWIACDKNKVINDMIKELKNRQKSGTADEKQDAAEAIEMYTNCKSNGEPSSLEYEKFQLADQKMILSSERCSNHARLALDELGEFSYPLPLSNFGLCFSQQGHQLLNTGLNEIATTRYMKGTINTTIPVSMLLNLPAQGTMTGVYFYNRVAGILHVNGNRQGNTMSFTESDEKGISTGRFDLILTGNSFTGKWINLKTMKEMPVKLTMN